MKINFHYQSNNVICEKEALDLIKNFESTGKNFDERNRNQIKLFEVDGKTINIKSFKKPNFFNKIIYRFFRKSKARRSFEYANFLQQNNIGTPQPIAYFEKFDAIGLTNSYYVSEHLNCDITFRELVENRNYPDWENILRQFTQFCFLLHQKGIEFKDHSPGNTLIIKNKETNVYQFYLVDLNRMSFHKLLSFKKRMKNLCRLSPHQEMIAIMSNEYAKQSNENEQEIYMHLWQYTAAFQAKFFKRKLYKYKIKQAKH